jgi:hypothetical protein
MVTTRRAGGACVLRTATLVRRGKTEAGIPSNSSSDSCPTQRSWFDGCALMTPPLSAMTPDSSIARPNSTEGFAATLIG